MPDLFSLPRGLLAMTGGKTIGAIDISSTHGGNVPIAQAALTVVQK